jgi:hypothetical protein
MARIKPLGAHLQLRAGDHVPHHEYSQSHPVPRRGGGERKRDAPGSRRPRCLSPLSLLRENRVEG